MIVNMLMKFTDVKLIQAWQGHMKKSLYPIRIFTERTQRENILKIFWRDCDD
jgi:hypothetical protein